MVQDDYDTAHISGLTLEIAGRAAAKWLRGTMAIHTSADGHGDVTEGVGKNWRSKDERSIEPRRIRVVEWVVVNIGIKVDPAGRAEGVGLKKPCFCRNAQQNKDPGNSKASDTAVHRS